MQVHYSKATGQNAQHTSQTGGYHHPRADQKSHGYDIVPDKINGQQQKTDSYYFSSLQHYKPIFYSGQGVPLFLQNQHWCKSLACILFFDVIFTISIIMFLISGNNPSDNNSHPIRDESYSLVPKSTKQPGDNVIILVACIICLILINVFYFLCQFMNPGVINPHLITEQRFEKEERQFCQFCNSFKTSDMNHCKECKVCVWGLDHHCGFFNKCIAGWQKWAFYAFMTSLFGGFLLIVVCMGLALTY